MKIFNKNSSTPAEKGKIITLNPPSLVTKEKQLKAKQDEEVKIQLAMNFWNAFTQLKEHKEKNGETDKSINTVKIGEIKAFDVKYDLMVALIPNPPVELEVIKTDAEVKTETEVK
jgi:hypothetical protein